MRQGNRVVALLMCLVLIGTVETAYAANLADFKNVNNQSILSDEALAAVNAGIEKIPCNVVDLYNQVGGTLSFTNGALESAADLRGLYWYATSNIEIRADEATVTNPNYSFKSSLPHELGHFIHAKTYSALSPESKKQLSASYEHWRKYSTACYSESETFATLYSWYKIDDRILNDNERKMFQEAEKLCKSVKTKLESGIEYGPGMYL